MSEDAFPPVPARYRGVWVRTVLETPDHRDTATFVRWMQLARWHADLRVPVNSGPLQGFCGTTEVANDPQGRELCTWHRQFDYEPPRPTPDTGAMVFESTERIIETGVHGVYREVWERLPHSNGPLVALVESTTEDGTTPARLFMAGRYLMRVHPRGRTGPDFEISFGVVAEGMWSIEQSTAPGLAGQSLACSIERTKGTGFARVSLAEDSSQHNRGSFVNWRIIDWSEADEA